MRTFPKELAEFRLIVEGRASALRQRTYQELVAGRPEEQVCVQGRHATIMTIVNQKADGSLEVVVVGHMPSRWLRCFKNVAVDGFYMRPSGITETMPDSELWNFG